MTHLGDITKIHGGEAPVVDVVIGGSPCQDLSIAGKRAGLAGARSGLYMEQIRIIKEMRERDMASGRTGEFVRPRYMVWENVPYALQRIRNVMSRNQLCTSPPKNSGIERFTPVPLCIIIDLGVRYNSSLSRSEYK